MGRNVEELRVHIMGRNVEEHVILHEAAQDVIEAAEVGEQFLSSLPKSPNQNSRPSSMVIKKAHAVFPAHLVAEAISTLHGLDMQWSGPITPYEMQYVQQYVYAKYPEYCNGLVEERDDNNDLSSLCINDESSDSMPDEKRNTPRSSGTKESSSPSFASNSTDLDRTQLEPSKLLEILTKKASFQGNFISIPEIQVRNKALQAELWVN